MAGGHDAAFSLTDDEAQLQAAIALSLQCISGPNRDHKAPETEQQACELDTEGGASQTSTVAGAKHPTSKPRKQGPRKGGNLDATPSEMQACFELLDPKARGSVDVYSLITVRQGGYECGTDSVLYSGATSHTFCYPLPPLTQTTLKTASTLGLDLSQAQAEQMMAYANNSESGGRPILTRQAFLQVLERLMEK